MAAPNAEQRAAYWDRRYDAEGSIWGSGPSPLWPTTLRALAGTGTARILDFGCGYGRDTIAFAKRGHDAVGLDASHAAIRLARAEAERSPGGSPARFLSGALADLPRAQAFDAIHSHRVLHLLSEDEAAGFGAKAAALLRPGGILCLSARSQRGFDAGTMRMAAADGTVEYLDSARAGHLLSFWDAKRFARALEGLFEIDSIVALEERESTVKPVATPLIAVVARRAARGDQLSAEHT